jgi:hypothetical protein
MENDPWKPWSGATVFRGCLFVPVFFIVGVGLFMLSMLPSLHATLATKALVVVLVAAVIGCAVATIMLSRVSRHVSLEGGLWKFLSGAPPEYPEALSAWRWGRRFRVCWMAAAAAMGAIALTEVLAGNW